jgi:tetratricopeptide (TPR) repeat protein
MPNAYLLGMLLLLISLACLAWYASKRGFFAAQTQRILSRLMAKRTAQQSSESKTTLVEVAANQEEAPHAKPRLSWDQRAALLRQQWRERQWRAIVRENRRLLASLLILLIAIMAIWRLPTLLSNQEDRFIILVAPFHEQNQELSQTSYTLADQFVDLLERDGRVVAHRVSAPPTNFPEALSILQEYNADVLVWGNIMPGALLGQDSLIPAIAYRPSGAYAPLSWDGYQNRFAMPQFFTVADDPINLETVLAPFLLALSDYSAGNVDQAYTSLGNLLERTPALMPNLPYALRGNIMWARGEYTAAINEYQQALGQPDRGELAGIPTTHPALTNNLGAIMQDAGSPQAPQVFAQTVSLLNGQDMGELRYNFGLLYLQQDRIKDAISSFEVARTLLPTSSELLLQLSEAYRRDLETPVSSFAKATQAIDQAERQIEADVRRVPANLRTIVNQRLSANLATQRAVNTLSQLFDFHSSLLWELQGSDDLDEASLSQVRDMLENAVERTEAMAVAWNSRSASEDSASQAMAALIAFNQFRRADAQLSERQIWYSALEVEIARINGVEPPRGLGVLWDRMFGARTALGRVQNDLKRLVELHPNDIDATVLYGELLLLSKGSNEAIKYFDQAAQVDPSRPEPVFGQAQVAQREEDIPRTIERLEAAIDLNPAYFPARQMLAAIANEQGNWALAVEQWRWLNVHRPSMHSSLQLAKALQASGEEFFPEAQDKLLSIINDPNLSENDKIPALTALGNLYHEGGFPEDARRILERAQASAPYDSGVSYELGRVLLTLDERDAAAKQFQVALDNAAQPVDAHLALAQYYTELAQEAILSDVSVSASQVNQQEQLQRLRSYLENMRMANEHYRAAFRTNKANIEQLHQIGERLLASDDYELAVQVYTRITELSQRDIQAYLQLARAQLGVKQLERARSAALRAIDLSEGNNATGQSILGDVALERNQVEQATELYNTALQQQGDLSDAYLGLGKVAMRAENWSVAAAHFQRATELNHNWALAHFWLAEAWLSQGNAQAALGEYRQAILLKPSYAEAFYGLARAQNQSSFADQRQQVSNTLELALVIRPSYAEVWLERGKLEEQQGNYDRAQQAYTQAISANADMAEPRYRRAHLYMRQERMSDAEKDLKTAISVQKNFPEAHYWLGRVYLAQNRPQNARDEFITASSQRDNHYPDARFYQGIAEERLGLREAAIASFQSALDMSDGNAWTNDARVALQRLGAQ